MTSHRVPIGFALVTVLGAALLSPAALLGRFCGENEPAFPVPKCRHQSSGEKVACNHSQAVRLWPEGFRPGRPDEKLPDGRDSTQWRSFSIPGFRTGHELFQSVDVVGDYLYVAYNAGLQVWSIAGNRAENPLRQIVVDGWRGDFLAFPSAGENDFFTDDVAAIDLAGGDESVLVALSGKDGVGLTLWKHAPRAFDLLYQDPSTDLRQVRVAELGGTVYVFAASPKGVFVYDATRALQLNRCLDSAGSGCGGVFRGRLGEMVTGRYLDVLEKGGKIYVAASDGDPLPARPLGLEIWEIASPASPESAVRKFSGLSTNTRGPALFEYRGSSYLAVIEPVGSDRMLKIFNVDACLDGDGCGSLGSPVWSKTLSSWPGPAHFLTYSTSGGAPFLYYGLTSINFLGPAIEQLFDLTSLGSTSQITEITETGGTYTDPCNGKRIDYWSDYYPRNEHGLRNLSPQIGKFKGKYFYRAAWAVLDVHVRTKVTPTLTVSGPKVGFPGSAYEFEAKASGCTPSASYGWDAGGGQLQGTGATVRITWPAPGQKTVKVTNGGCAGAQGVATIDIQDPEPQLSSFAVTPAAPRVCETPVFTWEVSGRPAEYDFRVRNSAGEVVHSGSGTDVGSFGWPTGASTPPGSYRAVLRAANPDGRDRATLNFNLGPATLEFTANPSYDGAPEPRGVGESVEFSLGTAGASKWIWDFGDGTTRTFTDRDQGEAPAHTYGVGGTFVVEVTIENCAGARKTRQIDIEIEEESLAVVKFQAEGCVLGFCEVCTHEPVTFRQSISGDPTLFEYDWDGDGSFERSSATPVERHVYRTAGQFSPRIRIRRGSREATFTHQRPVVITDCAASTRITGPASLQIQQRGTFRATANNCTPSANGWRWTASGGGRIGGSAATSEVQITWSTPGTKEVTASNAGCPGAEAKPFEVSVPRPSIEVEGPAELQVGRRGTYKATASDCSPVADGWTWTPGDAGQVHGDASGDRVRISWSAAGAKTVAAKNRACAAAEGRRNVRVTGPVVPPDAEFDFSPPRPRVGDEVTFDASASSGEIATWDWSFGDGGTASGVRVTHSFRRPGSFEVTLTVAEAGCASPSCQDRESRTVVIEPLPSPPKPPSSLEAVAKSSREILLRWRDNSNDETGFRIESQPPDIGEITVPANTTEWVASGLKPATEYAFRVGAFNPFGDSALSNRATASTFPGCPAKTLCIDDEPGDRRFRVTVSFETELGGGRKGDAVASTLKEVGITKGGILSFFGRANPEVLVKVLDGCGFNGHYWIFYGATTNLGFELTIEDTRGGMRKTFRNPDLNPAESVADIEALATCDADELTLAAPALGVSADVSAGVDWHLKRESQERRAKDGKVLRIDDEPGDGRFRITLRFNTELGGGLEGDALATSLVPVGISRGGILSFLDRANPEVLVEVLDGCSSNGHYWVFFAATTNLGFALTVEDTETGVQKLYENSDKTVAETVADTLAFACGGS